MTPDAIKINWLAQTFRSNWRSVSRPTHCRPIAVTVDAADSPTLLLLDVVVVMLSDYSLNVPSV